MNENKPINLLSGGKVHPVFNKGNLLCLMAIWVFVTIYYKECQKKKILAEPAELHMALAREVDGTDPIRAISHDTINVIGKVYEGLYTFHPFNTPAELMPNLAEAMPEISPDHLTYTFKIKKDIYFQDDRCFPNGKGRMFKASDVIYTLKRLVDPNNTLVPYRDFINGKIKGLDAWKKRAIYAEAVEGLQLIDDHTLQVTLTTPWPTFLNFLTMCATFIVAQEAVEYYKADFVNHPVGTGPFVLQGGFDSQAKRLEFVPNPTFREKIFPTGMSIRDSYIWGDYKGKKLPIVDKLVNHIITEETPCLLKLKNAEIHVARVDTTSFIWDHLTKEGKLSAELADKGLVVTRIPMAHTALFVFNHSHAIFHNPDLRRAISMAFDREDFNQRFHHGTGEVALSLLPPVLMNEADRSNLKNPYAYDLERAKAYLIQAGYPEGKGVPEITLDVRSGNINRNKADFFAQCMGKIGIKVKVISNTWPELLDKIYQGRTMMHEFAWRADEPDAGNFLQLIDSKELAGARYEHPVFKKLFKQFLITHDETTRHQLCMELNQIVSEEVPVIFSIHLPMLFLSHEWVKNLPRNDYDVTFSQYLAIDKELRAKKRDMLANKKKSGT